MDNVCSKGDNRRKNIIDSKTRVIPVFLLKLIITKAINAKSAIILNGRVAGSASAIPRVNTKISGIIIIMPCKKMNE
jgi:hypothetical protein